MINVASQLSKFEDVASMKIIHRTREQFVNPHPSYTHLCIHTNTTIEPMEGTRFKEAYTFFHALVDYPPCPIIFQECPPFCSFLSASFLPSRYLSLSDYPFPSIFPSFFPSCKEWRDENESHLSFISYTYSQQ